MCLVLTSSNNPWPFSGTALSGSLGLDDAHQTAIRTALLRFLEADPALSKVLCCAMLSPVQSIIGTTKNNK